MNKTLFLGYKARRQAVTDFAKDCGGEAIRELLGSFFAAAPYVEEVSLRLSFDGWVLPLTVRFRLTPPRPDGWFKTCGGLVDGLGGDVAWAKLLSGMFGDTLERVVVFDRDLNYSSLLATSPGSRALVERMST